MRLPFLAGPAVIASLALSACQTPLYEDPPPRFNEGRYARPTPAPVYQGQVAPPYSYVEPGQEIASDAPPARTAPPPSRREQTAPRVTPPPAPPRDLPSGTPVSGKPGFVTSPFAPSAGYVDTRGFSPGEQVKCPYTGKIFLVP